MHAQWANANRLDAISYLQRYMWLSGGKIALFVTKNTLSLSLQSHFCVICE